MRKNHVRLVNLQYAIKLNCCHKKEPHATCENVNIHHFAIKLNYCHKKENVRLDLAVGKINLGRIK